MSIQNTRIQLLEDSVAFQELYDTLAELFEQPIWTQYLTPRFTQSLEWRSILGVLANSPAASVIDFSGDKPLRTRPTISKLNGELVTFGNAWQMSKRDLREFYDLQDRVGQLGITTRTLIEFLYPDMQHAAVGPHKTIDRFLLEAMSTGQMTLTNANNPDGTVFNEALDWGIEQRNVATLWTDTAATPLTDIRAVMQAGEQKGATYRIMKMSRATYNNMINTDQIRQNVKAILPGLEINAIGGLLPLVSMNQILIALDLPIIEIIDYPIRIQSNGVDTTIRPFADHRVTFSQDNNFGEMQYTYANEEREPNPTKSYARVNNVLISRYRDVKGNEFTENEFNAFPVINVARNIIILKTNATS